MELEFPPDTDPVDYAETLLRESGLESRECLRTHPAVPRGKWIIRPRKSEAISFSPSADPLVSATILGLSGPFFYCSQRPIIWTRERLSRSLSLYKLDLFYEN